MGSPDRERWPLPLYNWVSSSPNGQPGRPAGDSRSPCAQHLAAGGLAPRPPLGCRQCYFVNPPGENRNLHTASSCFFLMLARRASSSKASRLPSVALPCLLSDGPAASSLRAGPWTPTTLWGLCPGPCPASASRGSGSPVPGTRLAARPGLQPPASHTVPPSFLPVSPGHLAPLPLAAAWGWPGLPLEEGGTQIDTVSPSDWIVTLCCQFKDSLTLLSREEGLGAPARARLTPFPLCC